MVRSKRVQSLGWDPRYHEELQNGPKIKLHIRKVVSGFQKMFGFFSIVPGRFYKVP